MINVTASNSSIEEKNIDLVFIVFCLWTFILLCRPQDIFPFVVPFRPALLSSVLSLLSVLVAGVFSRGPSILAERQVKLYTILLCIMIFGIPFSLYRRLSFEAIFQGYIIVALYFIVFCKILDSIKKILKVLFVASVGVGIYLLFSLKSGFVVSGRLFFGNMFDPNDMAFFAVSFLTFGLLFLTRQCPLWKRLVSLSCIVSSVYVIVLTGSRGGVLAFICVVIFLLVRKSETVTLPMKGIFIGLSLIVLGTAPINVERYASILTIEEDYNVQGEEGRLTIWSTGLRIMMENPITGVGVGCFGEAIGRDREARGAESRAWQTAHNSAVQIGTETGVIGFLLFLLLSFNVLRIFNRGMKIAVSKDLVRICEMGFAGFLGLFISGMFLSQAYSIYWAFYVAFSAVVSQLLSRQQSLRSEEKIKARWQG